VTELAQAYDVPAGYIAEACTWSPARRAAVADGTTVVSIAKDISSRRRLAPPPASAAETLGDQLGRALRIVAA
jgi:hypothetical protein